MENKLANLEAVKEDFGDKLEKKLAEISVNAFTQRQDLEHVYKEAQAKFAQVEVSLNEIIKDAQAKFVNIEENMKGDTKSDGDGKKP